MKFTWKDDKGRHREEKICICQTSPRNYRIAVCSTIEDEKVYETVGRDMNTGHLGVMHTLTGVYGESDFTKTNVRQLFADGEAIIRQITFSFMTILLAEKLINNNQTKDK